MLSMDGLGKPQQLDLVGCGGQEAKILQVNINRKGKENVGPLLIRVGPWLTQKSPFI